MIGLIALNLVLRVIRAGVMDVALVGHIHSVHPHYPAGDPACLGIPAHAIADFEHSRHDASQPEAGQRLVKYLIQMDGVSRGDEAPRSFIVVRFLDAFDEELQLSPNCRWSAHRNPPLHDAPRATFLVMIRCLPLHMEGCADVASMGPVDCGTLA